MLNIVNSVSAVVAAATGVILVALAYGTYHASRSPGTSGAAARAGDARVDFSENSRLKQNTARKNPVEAKDLVVRCALAAFSFVSIGEWVLTLLFFLPYITALHRMPAYGWDYSISYLLGYHVCLFGIMLLTSIFGRLGFYGWIMCIMGPACFAIPAFLVISGEHKLDTVSATIVCLMAALPYMFARVISDPKVTDLSRRNAHVGPANLAARPG
jgi:hypothetical protein